MQYAEDLKPIDVDELKRAALAARGYIDHVYLHWTAGHYGQVYDDYHISIDHDGRIYFPDNESNLKIKREHTWQRNSRAIGIAVCGCWDAKAHNGWNCNLGSEGVTPAQIEVISAVTAVICKYAGIPVENVMTHCEAAIKDGYGPYSGDPETRWDLWYVRDFDGEMKPGGDVIRGKIRWYMA